MKRILIAGDSFAADWSKKYEVFGWVNMLSENFEVTNVAEAGVSEYKIYNQIEKINLNNFDKIIISHTSPFRIPVETHPLYRHDMLHHNCDLIYTDLKEKEELNEIKPIINFFENYFHRDFFEFTHRLILKEIFTKCPNAIHITFFESDNQDLINFYEIFSRYRGDANHLNPKGNKIVYEKIKELIYAK